MPASVWKAVPCGRICASAVGTWVWVPMASETRPSTKCAMRLFFARRLGVNVEDDGVGGEAERTGGQFLLDGGERIVERVHEDAAHDIHHQHALALGRLIQPGAAPRRARRIIERPQHMRRPLDEHQGLALVEGVVAERDAIDPGVEEFLRDGLGDAETAGGVLAIGDDEIERQIPPQDGDMFGDGGAAGAADDVADEQKTH